MGPGPMTGVLIRTGEFGHRHSGREGRVMIEAEIGEMHLQAREYQDGWQPPGAGREAWDRLSCSNSRRTNPTET